MLAQAGSFRFQSSNQHPRAEPESQGAWPRKEAALEGGVSEGGQESGERRPARRRFTRKKQVRRRKKTLPGVRWFRKGTGMNVLYVD